MEHVRAEIISIGDEILYGQTLDTNSHFISQKLDEIGVNVIRRTTIGDEDDEILKALKEAGNKADIIIITGGLGPTSDDRTKPCLSKFFNTPLSLNEQALQDVTEYFSRRGKSLTERNKQQAIIPEACEILRNPKGTAPGMWFNQDGKIFISIPGVPHEMEYLIVYEIITRIKRAFNLPFIYHKLIKITGIGESFLADKIKDWENTLPTHVRLAYLPSPGELKLRLTVQGKNRQQMVEEVDRLVEDLSKYAKDYIYGYDGDQLEVLVGKLLVENQKTLAIAESCTGGYVAHAITSVEGSSRYFNGGVIAYHNDIKKQQLNVPQEVLEKHGAVSEEVVKLMAQNIRKNFNTDIGLATSGIAGPGGGTAEKPVGLVWVAYADDNNVEAKKLLLVKDRLLNIQLASKAILSLLHKKLKQID